MFDMRGWPVEYGLQRGPPAVSATEPDSAHQPIAALRGVSALQWANLGSYVLLAGSSSALVGFAMRPIAQSDLLFLRVHRSSWARG